MCINATWYLKEEESFFGIILVCWLSIISQMYPITALVLFLLAIYALANAYRFIETNIMLLRKFKTNEQDYCRLLSLLKSYHALTCEITDYVNECFGWIFIISVPFHFLAIIIMSFYIFGREEQTITIMEVTLAVVHVCHISVVCYAANFIRDQVCSNIQIYKNTVHWYTESFKNEG